MGLFERHKLIYSFIICSSIQRANSKINEQLWNFLLRGAGIFDKSFQPRKPAKCESFITNVSWDLIYCLQMEYADKLNNSKTEHDFTNFCVKVEQSASKF
jgi:dynein heavy chain